MASDHTAALKAPQFWSKRAALWLTQVEAQFNIRKVTSDLTKYSYIVVALDEDTATRVMDILTQPSSMHKHTPLKDRLVDTIRRSDWEAAAKILEEELSDSKPSELMDKMLTLFPPGESPFCLWKYSSASYHPWSRPS
ncbi:uncharacterized protein LOC115226716 [Octopus sinensis]|uniref:Uncharacterized protein LOC115226716 n=1 Tax=Octopus sinensis TaxID=2607531 RepID=A0A6P7TXY4_9MOLL|nr:uncharacterized protein LOC115226716 [Octopus sinensis]